MSQPSSVYLIQHGGLKKNKETFITWLPTVCLRAASTQAGAQKDSEGNKLKWGNSSNDLGSLEL